jgi:hypothetical protein
VKVASATTAASTANNTNDVKDDANNHGNLETPAFP